MLHTIFALSFIYTLYLAYVQLDGLVGLCLALLCGILLSGRFGWDEISFIDGNLLYFEMFWSVRGPTDAV